MTENNRRPLNIVVRMPNWLGDVVMAMPSLRYLHEAFPEARLLVAARRQFLGLLGMQPEAAGVIGAPSSGAAHMLPALWHGRRAVRHLAKTLDAGVLFSFSCSTALWLWRLHPTIRIGYSLDFRDIFLTHKIPCGHAERSQHFIQFVMTVAKRAEEIIRNRFDLPRRPVNVDADFALPRLAVSDEAADRVAESLQKAGVGKDYVAFAPACLGAERNWPAEHYRKVAEALGREYSLPVAVTGTADQADICAAASDGVPNAVNLAGKTSIADFAAVMAGARAVVGGDSGGTHIAAELGVPTVVVFGICNPGITCPEGKRVIRIDAGRNYTPNPADPAADAAAKRAAMAAVLPEEVTRALRTAL